MMVTFYATGHSTLGQPTANYVYRLMQTMLTQPKVLGMSVYTMKAPDGPCGDPPLFNGTFQHQLGCIVRHVYGAAGPQAARGEL